jgi:hypothetical protein
MTIRIGGACCSPGTTPSLNCPHGHALVRAQRKDDQGRTWTRESAQPCCTLCPPGPHGLEHIDHQNMTNKGTP